MAWPKKSGGGVQGVHGMGPRTAAMTYANKRNPIGGGTPLPLHGAGHKSTRTPSVRKK